MQTSQEYFTTIVYAKFGGQTECIMYNWKIVNRRILPQQTSQTYMYSSFFKRERQYDPFGAKEIINRGSRDTATTNDHVIARSLSVSKNMTRLERKKLSIEGYCNNKRFMYSSFFKLELQYDPFRAKENINRGILQQQMIFHYKNSFNG